MRHTLLVVSLMVLGLGFTAVSTAQTTDAATAQRISALEARVAALERMQAQGASRVAAPTPVATYSSSQPATVVQTATATAAPVAAAPTAADWNSLHRGMTNYQVTKLLGKPGDTRILPMSSTWYYPDIHGRSVEFDRDNRVSQWSQP